MAEPGGLDDQRLPHRDQRQRRPRDLRRPRASSRWTPRSTRTSGSARTVKLQLRAEVFNVFNRTNFLVGNDGHHDLDTRRTWSSTPATRRPRPGSSARRRPAASDSSPTPPTTGRRSSASGSASRRFASAQGAVSSRAHSPSSLTALQSRLRAHEKDIRRTRCSRSARSRRAAPARPDAAWLAGHDAASTRSSRA